MNGNQQKYVGSIDSTPAVMSLTTTTHAGSSQPPVKINMKFLSDFYAANNAPGQYWGTPSQVGNNWSDAISLFQMYQGAGGDTPPQIESEELTTKIFFVRADQSQGNVTLSQDDGFAEWELA
jgi:hypothetical protein